jgi:glycosyltransferase involved in cell wall biosynthesis
MIDKLPFLTVIVPVYNAERHIAAAIQSILEEQYPSLEILVIDDGSTDRSAEILRGFPEVTYYYQDNRGPASARNRGIRLAQGEFILFLDADDLFPKGKIRQQLSYFDQKPEIELTIGKSQVFFEEGANTSVIRFPDETHQVLNVLLGSGLYRKTAFEKVGELDENLRFGEDFDWFNRVREQEVPLLVTNDITLHYRRHSTNMTREIELVKLNAIQLLKRSLDRRRKEGEIRELRKLSEL